MLTPKFMTIRAAALLVALPAVASIGWSAATTAPTSTGGGAELTWFDGTLTHAVSQAKDEEQVVLVYFWRNESEYCAKLYQETLQHENTIEALSDYVLVSANYGDAMGAGLMERFNVQTLPFMLFVGPDGQPEDSIAGFLSSEDLVEELARVQRGENTRSGIEREIAAAEKGSAEEFELLFALAGKHQELGSQERHDEVIATVREADPECETNFGARAFLWKIQGQLFVDASEAAGYPDGDGGDPEVREKILAELDLKPLHEHLSRVKLDESRYEAWSSIANTENTRSGYKDSCKAFMKAWKFVPEDQAMNFAIGTSRQVMAMPMEPSSRDKKFVTELMDKAWKIAQAEAETEEYQETDRYLASVLARVAEAYNYAGKSKKAHALIDDCIELDPDGEYEAHVASWSEST